MQARSFYQIIEFIAIIKLDEIHLTVIIDWIRTVEGSKRFLFTLIKAKYYIKYVINYQDQVSILEATFGLKETH